MRIEEASAILQSGRDLGREAVAAAAGALLDGTVSDEAKAEFLGALARKGESASEIGWFVREFLAHAVRPSLDLATLDRPALDVCGTGGDKLGLFNVSTSAMFIVAAGGATVVKHGNRGVTSRSGSADVLEALGGRIDLSPDRVVEGVKQTGVAFMLAPAYHPTFKVIVPVRQRLAAQGQRTIFNLMGPLLNPLELRFQLAGVFDATLVPMYAQIMADLGRTRAWAVHGGTGDGRGMDELSTLGPNRVREAHDGATRMLDVEAADRFARPESLHQLAGGDAMTNAAILEGVVRGEIRGPKRDLTLLNAAAGLVVTGLAPDLGAGADLAGETVDSGRAFRSLQAWRAFA